MEIRVTTLVEVLGIMIPCLATYFGNIVATYPFSARAKDAVEKLS